MFSYLLLVVAVLSAVVMAVAFSLNVLL